MRGRGASVLVVHLLYVARCARFDSLCAVAELDLLRAVANLAQQTATWDAACDRGMHRLMCRAGVPAKKSIGGSQPDIRGEFTN